MQKLPAHEAETKSLEGDSASADQDVPLNTEYSPVVPTVKQNVAEPQATVFRAPLVASTLTGEPQDTPVHVEAPPSVFTATHFVDVGHDTAAGVVAESINTGDDQIVPLNVTACPDESTAMQNVVDRHDSETRDDGATLEKVVQVAPDKRTAFPVESPATQLLAAEHETLMSPDVSIDVGDDQVVPLNVAAYPALSTSAQNVVSTQLTDVGEPRESTSAGVDQVVPLNLSASPDESTATQNVVVVQHTDVRYAPTAGLTVDHAVPL